MCIFIAFYHRVVGYCEFFFTFSLSFVPVVFSSFSFWLVLFVGERVVEVEAQIALRMVFARL